MSQSQSASSSHATSSSTAPPHATTATAAPAPRAAAQPLWLLRPINPLEPPFYLAGVPQTVIVAAATSEDARSIAAAAAGPHDAEAWLDGAMAICNPLAVAEPGIVARDFSPLAPLPPATAAPENVDVPYVSGTGTVGETLTCTMGNWNGLPRSYAYAWASDGAPNSAVGPTYSIVPGDAGHSITCVVTATNELGSTAAPPSNAVVVSA